jgi:hypothetical protein
MNPAHMFDLAGGGLGGEPEVMDLSGWMSRTSAPTLGSIPVEDRPRAKKSTEIPIEDAAPPAPEVVIRPRNRGGYSQVGHADSSISKGNFLNPFYVDEETPLRGAVGVVKAGGFITAAVAGLYLTSSKVTQKRAGAKLPNPKATSLLITGLGMYAHPVLGWNHGALGKLNDSEVKYKRAVKTVTHLAGAALFGTLAFRTWD